MLIAATVVAQADAGARWPLHPRIVAVRETVAEIDRLVGDGGTTWACGLLKDADAPRSIAAWKKMSKDDPYPPVVEVVQITRAREGALERVAWRWTTSGVHEWEYRDQTELTRWSRRGDEIFTLLSAAGTGRGSFGVQVRTWSDAEGTRFWWSVKDTIHPKERERAGVDLPTLPEQPTLEFDEVRAWLEPEKRLAHLRSCTPEQAAQAEQLANSPSYTATELAIVKAIWVKR